MRRSVCWFTCSLLLPLLLLLSSGKLITSANWRVQTFFIRCITHPFRSWTTGNLPPVILVLIYVSGCES